MRKTMLLGLGGMLTIASVTGAALADVKGGVDAWSRGEYRKAVDEWRPLATAGDADAQFNIGQAYSLGRGVPVDLAVAETWFRKAAMQGHAQGEAKYGLVLFDRGKRAEAAPWLEKAVARGEPRAQLVLGTMLFNGDGVAKDWPRAYALLVRSAAAGTPRASEVQAQMDRFIPADQRQQGLMLASRDEAEARRPQLPPEIAGRGTGTAMRTTALPPSAHDAGKPEIIALNPRDSATAHPGIRDADSKGPGATTSARHAPARVPAPIEPGRPKPAGGDGWRVQLGAFGDPGNARRLWDRIGSRFPGASVSYVKSGAMTRVLAGPYGSKGAAAAACGSVRPCVPIGD